MSDCPGLETDVAGGIDGYGSGPGSGRIGLQTATRANDIGHSCTEGEAISQHGAAPNCRAFDSQSCSPAWMEMSVEH